MRLTYLNSILHTTVYATIISSGQDTPEGVTCPHP